MKIKKTPFVTQIEFTIDELNKLNAMTDPLTKNSILLMLVRILDKISGGDKNAASRL